MQKPPIGTTKPSEIVETTTSINATYSTGKGSTAVTSMFTRFVTRCSYYSDLLRYHWAYTQTASIVRFSNFLQFLLVYKTVRMWIFRAKNRSSFNWRRFIYCANPQIFFEIINLFSLTALFILFWEIAFVLQRLTVPTLYICACNLTSTFHSENNVVASFISAVIV